MPPVGHGVCLVDDEQSQPAGETVEHPAPEPGVGQPLRRDQQHVESRPTRSPCSIADHSSMFAELRVAARSPARVAAATWSRISDSSGETTSVGPARSARRTAVAAQ